MTLDEFLATAWAEHAEKPQEVADRLAASLHLVSAPEQIPPFANLLTHVYGEHLAQWSAGVSLLDSLRTTLPASDRSSAGALDRSIAALRYAGGDGAALEPLSVEDRVSALATASSALAGRHELTQALAAYSQALHLADDGLPPGSPALRALAVGGNNLAASLEEKTNRDAGETQGMISAARGGLKYWKLAGTWLEEERAEYRLSRSLLQAGDAEAAVQSARRCVGVCKQNDAPAFEQFFGYAVLARAHRAAGNLDSFEAARTAAFSSFEQVPDEERQWCESELRELRQT
jgi:hypothetical protein